MNDTPRQATRLDAIGGHYDPWLLGCALTLAALGVVMVASSSIAMGSSPFYFLVRHVVFLGVGIGLGLQKLAANYVSGFVVLAERALRIGDMVRVDGFDGQITDIRARYTVIRSGSGRESIVPNEMMVTQRVENLSLADRRVWQSTVVGVEYGCDVELVQTLLRQAALSSKRVLREPAPFVGLTAFAADALEFTVGYWMNEPEAGALGLRSEVNLAILKALRAHGIDIPFPQRVVHAATPATPATPAPPPARGSVSLE